MSEEEAPNPRQWFENFVQIGAIVENVEETVKVLTEVFGLGPFRIFDWPGPGRENLERFYHGQPAKFTARLAFTDIGNTELELIQPVEGPSIWADYLAEHGPGLHHIRFNTYDLEPALEYLQGQGVDVAQMGHGVRPGSMFVNLDTEARVGFGLEIFKAVRGTDGRAPRPANDKPQP
jgi:catechol 2,3-dioxygenase-like lactoylglutathione lyase family enzyme